DRRVPQANIDEIVAIAAKVRQALGKYRRVAGLEWIIEFGANVYDKINLDIAVFQARRSPVLEEEHVNPAMTPEVYRFGTRGLPAKGILRQVRTQADIEGIDAAKVIVLVDINDFENNGLDFTQLSVTPSAILINQGGRNQHTGLNIRYINTFSAKPAFYNELAAMADASVAVSLDLDRSSGAMTYQEITEEELNKYSGYDETLRSNANIRKTELKQFEQFANAVIKTEELTEFGIHPDRSADELFTDDKRQVFSTVINGVRIVLPGHAAFLKMDNAAILQAIRGPLRLAISVFDDIILTWPSPAVAGHDGMHHQGLVSMYNRHFEAVSQLDSIRGWNYVGGGDIDESVTPVTDNNIRLVNSFAGGDYERALKDAQFLTSKLATLKKAGYSLQTIDIQFSEMSDQDILNLTKVMAKSGQFDQIDIYQVLGYVPVRINQTTYIVDARTYQRAVKNN
ncbi:MAG: hypothetical protein K8I00_07780, partial [Candidatus Omnitrophica bacterium]|nr:hypothetical protein [Candidatus Omnitrophota bacterium]